MKFTIQCPIFKQPIHVVFKDDISDLIKKHDLINTETTTAFVYRSPVEDSLYLVLKPSRFSMGILVHEVVHLVNMMFDYVNQDLDLKNDEFQAYYTQYLFEQILKKLKL